MVLNPKFSGQGAQGILELVSRARGGARAGACLPADGWAVSHYGRLWGCSGLGLMSTCRQVGLGPASSLLDGPRAQGSRGWYLLTDGWSWVPGLVCEEKSDPVPSSGQWLWALGVLRQPASCWVGCPGPPSSPPVGRHQLQDHSNPAAYSARTASALAGCLARGSQRWCLQAVGAGGGGAKCQG